jgi:hypothetical protein
VANTSTTYNSGASSVVYGLGIFGAWFYLIPHAPNFWMGIWAFFEAFAWPAILVYEAFKLLRF